MKTLGLIGGTSWVSTIEYYRQLNELTNAKLGGANYSRCIIHSLNFADIQALNAKRDWDGMFHLVDDASQGLIRAGADAIMLGANTLHLVADRLEKRLDVPLINLVEATALEIERTGIKTVVLLGTRFTMEMDFFKDRLAQHNIETLVPDAEDREFVHNSVFDELGKGAFLPATRTRYVEIITDLAAQGAEGAILGCTEIPLLIKAADSPVPVFDTTAIHSAAAVNFALS